MPEGDTLYRTATVLREVLLGRRVASARARPGGALMGRVVGSTIDRVDSVGKHLLIGFDTGLTLHTHLRMNGSWHRYRPGEPWRRSAARAVSVIEVAGAVAVCFDAPVVELIETRALALHPALVALGPDLIEPEPDVESALRRLADPTRASMSVGEAILDQRALAGLGNVYRSEVLWQALVSPFTLLGEVAEETLRTLIETGARLLRANRDTPNRVTTTDARGGAPGSAGPRRGQRRLNVYHRAGRPCPRCATPIRSAVIGDLPRRVYWCPACQPEPAAIQAVCADPGSPDVGSVPILDARR